MRIIGYIVILVVLFVRCGSSYTNQSPLDKLKHEYATQNAYTITLHDMDLKDGKHHHKYKVFFFHENGKYEVKTTPWYPVDIDFFALHEANLGMEILSKQANGNLNNLPTPPGFTQVVGNELYGSWNPYVLEEDTLTGAMDTVDVGLDLSTWSFKDEHIELAKELEIDSLKITYFEYYEFASSYHLNRPYYGVRQANSDSTHYGTRSHYWFYRRPYFYERRRQKNNFYTKNMNSNSGGNRGGGSFGK